MKYATNDGHRYEANTAEELVEQMHAMSLAQAEDDAAWMKEVAERTTEQSGEKIRSDNQVNFVADLTRIGYIKEIPDVQAD